jgi:hypothetical protein
MTQVVEHLPNKCEALSSNPSTRKKKRSWKTEENLTNANLRKEILKVRRQIKWKSGK